MQVLIAEPRRLLLAEIPAPDGDILRLIVCGRVVTRFLQEPKPFVVHSCAHAGEPSLVVNVIATLLCRDLGLLREGEPALGTFVFVGYDGAQAQEDVPDWLVRLAEHRRPEEMAINDLSMVLRVN